MSTAMQRASMRGEQMTARPALPPDPQPTIDHPAGDAAVRRAYAGSERLHEGERRVLCGVQKKQFGELERRALCWGTRGLEAPVLLSRPRPASLLPTGAVLDVSTLELSTPSSPS